MRKGDPAPPVPFLSIPSALRQPVPLDRLHAVAVFRDHIHAVRADMRDAAARADLHVEEALSGEVEDVVVPRLTGDRRASDPDAIPRVDEYRAGVEGRMLERELRRLELPGDLGFVSGRCAAHAAILAAPALHRAGRELLDVPALVGGRDRASSAGYG